MADQSLNFNDLMTAETAARAADLGITVEQYRAEIVAKNAAFDAAADANRKKSLAAWAALSPAQKAEWGGYPDVMLTDEETYED